MKYLAILDDDVVSNLELGAGLSIRVMGKHKKVHQIALKPLIQPTLVSDEGKSMYLTQGHINAMRAYEQKQMMNEIFESMEKIRQMKHYRLGTEWRMTLGDDGHWKVVKPEEEDHND